MILAFLATSSCGYKVLESLDSYNLNIKEIKSSGDKRINFKIKNDLIFKSSQTNKINLIIDLQTIKEKKVKEKNIKNEITKYEINISTNVEFKIIDKLKSFKFRLNETGSYSVSNQYSQTLNNEKQLIKTLAENISNQILENLKSKLNDL